VPPPGDDAIAWYHVHAGALAGPYETLSPEEVHAWLHDLLADKPALVFDVGAGTGRDAAWFAAKGMRSLQSSRPPKCVIPDRTFIQTIVSVGSTIACLRLRRPCG
jgi:hypothetical protein